MVAAGRDTLSRPAADHGVTSGATWDLSLASPGAVAAGVPGATAGVLAARDGTRLGDAAVGVLGDAELDAGRVTGGDRVSHAAAARAGRRSAVQSGTGNGDGQGLLGGTVAGTPA